jgi:transcriptional regulator with XRE-family HTH domain
MCKRKPNKVSEQLRTIIDKCGLSRYELAKRTKIDESALAKFYNGQRMLSGKALDRFGEFLKLTITMGRKPDSRKGK